MKIIANEFVLPITDKECHANHILPLENGKVFCVCFYGSKEGNDDVRIYGSMRNPADGSWSQAVPLTEDDGQPHWNPVLLRRNDGSVVLFYKVGKPIADWKTRCMISYDDCQTWSESFEMIEGDESGGRGPVRNKAVYLADGSILAPGSTEKGEWKCFFDRSTDEGKTWERSVDLRVPAGTLDKYDNLYNKGIIQPTIWQSEEGVHALMRSSEGSIYRTDSTDAVNWCPPYAIDMPNNNSGIDLDRLPDGRIILCCNPVSKDWGARSPISLFESRDNGKTFTLLTHLTTMPGEFSYPVVIYKEGKLHVSYTWKRKTVQYFCLENI